VGSSHGWGTTQARISQKKKKKKKKKKTLQITNYKPKQKPK
jgi:hypothetical protein